MGPSNCLPHNHFLILLLFLLLLSLVTISSSNPSSSSSSSIYDVLRSHGLPMGLLPKGIKDFTMDPTGYFEVHLDQACNAKFENQVHYDWNVSGTLSYGQIASLSGISAQELFLWFPVKGIRVDVPSSGLIYFDVGVIFKQFSLSLFESPPDCTAVASSPDLLLFRDAPLVPQENQSGKHGNELDQGDVLRAVS